MRSLSTRGSRGKNKSELSVNLEQITHHNGAHFEIHKVLDFGCHLAQKHQPVLSHDLEIILLKSLPKQQQQAGEARLSS